MKIMQINFSVLWLRWGTHGCYLYFLYTHITPQLSLSEVGIILIFTSEETKAQGVSETSKGVKILSSKAGVSTWGSTFPRAVGDASKDSLESLHVKHLYITRPTPQFSIQFREYNLASFSEEQGKKKKKKTYYHSEPSMPPNHRYRLVTETGTRRCGWKIWDHRGKWNSQFSCYSNITQDSNILCLTRKEFKKAEQDNLPISSNSGVLYHTWLEGSIQISWDYLCPFLPT